MAPQRPDLLDLQAWTAAQLGLVEAALERWVTADVPAGQLDHGAPAELVQAMRYAVLDGGKRLRPLLVLAACEAVQGHAAGLRCGLRSS
jgi:farnesyl diphosphate synthase